MQIKTRKSKLETRIVWRKQTTEVEAVNVEVHGKPNANLKFVVCPRKIPNK